MKQTGNNWWHSHRHYDPDPPDPPAHPDLLQELLNVEILVVQRIDQILRGEVAVHRQPLEEFEAQIIGVRNHRVGHHRVDCVADRAGTGYGRGAATGHHLRCIVVARTRSALALHLHLHLLLLVCCCGAAGLLHELLLLHGQLLLLRVAHVHAGHLHLAAHHATASADASTSWAALLLLQQLLHLHVAACAGSHVLLLLLLSHQLLLHLGRRQLHLRSIRATHHAASTATSTTNVGSISGTIRRAVGHEVT